MITTPHLELEQLLEAAASPGPSAAVMAHLDECPSCRAEFGCWAVVSGGVRELFAGTPPVATSVDGLVGLDPVSGAPLASSSRRPGGRMRPLRGSRPRKVVVGGAAAAVGLIIGGTSYGLAADLSAKSPRPASRSAGAAGLTAVTGCSELAASTGTLQQVNGSDLVLKTPDGQSVTVTTSPSTQISREVTGTLSDVTNGAHVFVSGSDVGGTIRAGNVLVGTGVVKQPIPPQPAQLPAPGNNGGSGPMSLTAGLASGTVTGTHGDGFTVVLPDGTQVPITTRTSTSVVKITSATLSQLQSGVFTVAVGNRGANGTLAATTVEQGSAGPGGIRKPLLPGGLPKPSPAAGIPLPQPKLGPGGGFPSLPDLGCKPSTIAAAALVVLG